LVKNFLIDSLLLLFILTGVIADNHILKFILIPKLLTIYLLGLYAHPHL